MKFLTKKQKGFTLIELMISIFIFMIIVSIVIEIFGKQVVTSRHARILQRNIEDAEFAMNYVAKTLRTSSLPTSEDQGTTTGSGSATTTTAAADQILGTDYVQVLYAYDYSQKECFKFSFEEVDDEGTLMVYTIKEYDGEPIGNVVHICTYDDNYSDGRKLTSGDVTGGFYMSPTREDKKEEEGETEVYYESMGKVTISLEIDNRATEEVLKENEGEIPIGVQNMIIIQSSVALRDYPGDLTF